MQDLFGIPAFSLYGENKPFPDVVHCEGFAARAPIYGWQIAPHRHGQMAQIFVLRSGQAQASVDGQTHLLTAGMVLFVPEHCVHGFVFQPGTEGAVFSFPLAVLRSIAPQTADLTAALAQPISGVMDAPMADVARHLQALTASQGAFRAAALIGLAHGFLAMIAQLRDVAQAGALRPVPARMARFDALIAQHMADGWSPCDYARALAITTGQLSRICRAATGTSASAYLEQKLMVEACRMLAFTLFPVSEIGYRLGYSDPSYFSKRFRALRQLTPSAYRAQFSQ